MYQVHIMILRRNKIIHCTTLKPAGDKLDPKLIEMASGRHATQCGFNIHVGISQETIRPGDFSLKEKSSEITCPWIRGEKCHF